MVQVKVGFEWHAPIIISSSTSQNVPIIYLLTKPPITGKDKTQLKI